LLAGFNDENLIYQTRQRLQDYVMDHEKATLAELARQPNTSSVTPGPRLAADDDIDDS
jgi:hypothetical protein